MTCKYKDDEVVLRGVISKSFPYAEKDGVLVLRRWIIFDLIDVPWACVCDFILIKGCPKCSAVFLAVRQVVQSLHSFAEFVNYRNLIVLRGRIVDYNLAVGDEVRFLQLFLKC